MSHHDSQWCPRPQTIETALNHSHVLHSMLLTTPQGQWNLDGGWDKWFASLLEHALAFKSLFTLPIFIPTPTSNSHSHPISTPFQDQTNPNSHYLSPQKQQSRPSPPSETTGCPRWYGAPHSPMQWKSTLCTQPRLSWGAEQTVCSHCNSNRHDGPCFFRNL